MTNIIDYNYFKGKLQIPNVAEDTDVQTYVTALITEYQPEFLIKLLGNTLYPQFKAWYETLPLDTASPFNGILVGKSFTHNGSDYIWVGLQNAEKVSPLANYVYAQYKELNVSQSVPSGEVRVKTKNAESVNPTAKIVTQWNAMVLMLVNYLAYMDKYFPNDLVPGEFADMAFLGSCAPDVFQLRNSLGL